MNFSPDGKKILTTSNDNNTKIWDTESGGLLADLKKNVGIINIASYSPDGKMIMACADDGTVQLWNGQTAEFLRELKLPGHAITAAIFSPDSRRILTTIDRATAAVWDADSGIQLNNLDARSHWLDSVTVGPISARTMGLLTKDGTIQQWDVKNGELPSDIANNKRWIKVNQDGKLTAILKEHAGQAITASFTTDGTRAVTISPDNTAKIWNVKDGSLIRTLKEPDGALLFAVLLNQGKETLTINATGQAIIWDTTNGVILSHLDHLSESIERDKAVYLPVYSPDGLKVFLGSAFEPGKILDTQTGALLAELQGISGYTISSAFSPDGSKFVTLSEQGMCQLWDADRGLLKAVLATERRFAFNSSLTFSQDSKRLLTMFSPDTVKLWNSETGNLIADLSGRTDRESKAIFSPDGTKILTILKDFSIRLSSAANGNPLRYLKGHKGTILTASFSADSKKILTSSADHTAKIWDLQSGTKSNELQFGKSNISVIIFSPDAAKVLTDSFLPDFYATPVEKLSIWDSQSGNLMAELKGHAKAINSIYISPDAKRIVTLNNLGASASTLWNGETGSFVATLKRGKNVRINSIEFSADSKTLLIVAGDYSAEVWNAVTGAAINTLGTPSSNGYRTLTPAAISPDGKFAVTSASETTAKVWNTQTGATLYQLNFADGELRSVRFTPDGKKIITIFNNGLVQIYDAGNGVSISKLASKKFKSMILSDDGKKLLTVANPDTVNIWDTSSEELLSTITARKLSYGSIQFSPHGRKLITWSKDQGTRLWDVEKGALVTRLNTDTSAKQLTAIFSDNEKKVLTMTSTDEPGLNRDGVETDDPYSLVPEKKAKTSAAIWDTQNGKLLTVINNLENYYSPMDFSADGSRVLTWATRNAASIWDAVTGQPITGQNGTLTSINSAAFCPGSTKILTTTLDGIAKVWDGQNGKLIYTFFAVDSTDYFGIIPGGYYMCTPNAAKLLHYSTKNLEVITYDQLDIKYNRPDKVLQAMGCADTALINAYHRAYLKRIKKLNIDTTQFRSGYSVPRSEIQDRFDIAPIQNRKKLRLRITGIDSALNLDRYNVWVNGVPVYGVRGISLKSKQSNKVDVKVDVMLSNGQNRIETSVINVNGTESYRVPMFVTYKPATTADTGRLYFIGIGIDRFAEPGHNLSWSVADIQRLASGFRSRYGQNATIVNLLNEDFTAARVGELKKILAKTNINDEVVIAYSGHGLLNNKYDYYLSTYPVNFAQPEQNGLPYEELEELVAQIHARKKLLLIDACHSGQVDAEDLKTAKLNREQAQRIGVGSGRIWLAPAKSKAVSVPVNNFELMQHLFGDVGRNTGTTVISAAAGTQQAQELGQLQAGVFAYSILEYMREQQHCNVSALKAYVNDRVADITCGVQRPTTRSENNAFDWQIW
ncbi:MAG: caspase family protein [Bacteroidota bacterium]|nr:caspase family protein [Bacteroidota bacterium]